MRTLILYRGAPGCGKSTHIHNCGLDQYKLSADDIRLQISSPILDLNGNLQISQSNDKRVWEQLFNMLENRMKMGCFTIIDATNSKTAEMKRYKDLADKYRYRIAIVDMTHIPIDVCKQRNAGRNEYKRVPDAVIDKMYARFLTQSIPSGIKRLEPDELLDYIKYKPIDLSSYQFVHICGDIHSCYDPLKEYWDKHYNENNFYIFCGDYLDRGTQHAKTLNFLFSIMNKPNVLFLEGNHDRMIYEYGNDTTDYSREFANYTLPDLQQANVDKKQARMFYRKLAQVAYFTYDNNTYFVCHGGISSLPENLTLVPACQFIQGVGKYEDWNTVAESWSNSTDVIQIHGHRNIYDCPIINCAGKIINLEGKVEFGGALRTCTLSHNDDATSSCVIPEEFPNTAPISPRFIKTENNYIRHKLPTPENLTQSQVAIYRVVDQLRLNKYVAEKKFGHISSFNFDREAFIKGIWDEQTTKARGLYIDTANYKIHARGYEKFFRIDEPQVGGLDGVKAKAQWPITLYEKSNGYLGLISYDTELDTLFYTTKSNPDSEYAQHFKTIFEEAVSELNRAYLKTVLKTNNCTLAVEVIDPVFDPHIIKYDHNMFVALDLIYNDIDFHTMPYEQLCLVAKNIDIDYKKLKAICYNYEEFYNIYAKALTEQNEGLVAHDANNWMFKIKTDYYTFWKHMRGVAQSVIHTGNYKYTGSLTLPEANYFYAWIKNYWTEYHKSEHKISIIDLRERYLKERDTFLASLYEKGR